MNLDNVMLYLAVCFVVTITPGPTMLLALSNGASGRWRVAAMGMLGAAASDLVLISAVGLGLGALLAASETLFSLVRGLGVLYLAWLALQLWRAPPTAVAISAADVDRSARLAFRRSLLVALSNPKGLLFFSAFLPQFIDPHAAQWPQYATLGVATAALDLAVMAVYALGGAHLVRRLSLAAARRLNRACAAGLLALAGGLALYRRSAD